MYSCQRRVRPYPFQLSQTLERLNGPLQNNSEHKSEGQNILDVSWLLDIILPPLAQKQHQKEIEKEENDDLANATRNIRPRIRDYGRVSGHGKTSRGSSIQ